MWYNCKSVSSSGIISFMWNEEHDFCLLKESQKVLSSLSGSIEGVRIFEDHKFLEISTYDGHTGYDELFEFYIYECKEANVTECKIAEEERLLIEKIEKKLKEKEETERIRSKRKKN